MKKIFVSVFLFLIIIISFFVIIFNRFNTSMVINYVENKTGLKIELKDKNIWSFYPSISYNNYKINIFNKKKSLNINNASIIINKSYWPLSPIIIKLRSPTINYVGMEIRNIELKAKYSNNILNIENFNGNIVDGYLKTKGNIDLDEPYTFRFQGLFKNVSLNALMMQSNIADWKRVNIKLSSENFEVSGIGNKNENIKNSLKGNIPVNGSVYFTTTDEERFGAAFLSLLVEKIPNLSPVSQSIDFILSTYAGVPSSVNGKIQINDGLIKSEEILITNKNGKSTLRGAYNFIENNINGTINFYNENEILLEASLEGKIENPKILVAGKIFSDNEKGPILDIRELLEKGINTFIEEILSSND